MTLGVDGRPLPAYTRSMGAERRHRSTAAAGSRLAQLQVQAHRELDQMWKGGGMSRTACYRWLAGRMNMPLENCHIGMFDEAECERVIAICWEAAPTSSCAPSAR